MYYLKINVCMCARFYFIPTKQTKRTQKTNKNQTKPQLPTKIERRDHNSMINNDKYWYAAHSIIVSWIRSLNDGNGELWSVATITTTDNDHEHDNDLQHDNDDNSDM